MRMLFCCEFYYPSVGGVAEVMRQVAERMVLAGHDVTVATSHHAERKFETHNGVKIHGFKVEGNLVRGISGEAARYRDFVLALAPDVILIKAAQQWTFDALWPVLDSMRARKVFIPCGFSCLYEPAYSEYFIQLPQILRKFDHLIFYANEYRDIDFARAHGLTNISVLPNGASELEFDRPPDPNFRARLGIGDDDFVFFTVGSPISMKGHKAIAEAFAKIKLNGRSATLILNGNWPEPPKLPGRVWLEPVARPLRACRDKGKAGAFLVKHSSKVLREEGWAGLEMRIRRTLRRWREEQHSVATIDDWIKEARAQPGKQVACTNLPRGDVVQAFMTADLFVFASVVEYSPLVLFEAAAAGTPFLSVPVGNAEEIARWAGSGIICPAARDECGYTRVDPDVLARQMQRCMDDPDLLARLGETGRTTWLRQFTWHAIAPRYETILTGQSCRDGERKSLYFSAILPE
jgi:glycosyltransferase involved in cell wall biosynthesis